MADIILNDIVKIYEAPPQKRRGLRKAKVQVQPKRAVDGLTLTIPHGSFTVLVGPSGCGKTTLLRMIAGLEEITEGEIRMGDINITNLEPGDRGLAMVFQNYALYPHMTVRENIEFGLVNARLPRSRYGSACRRHWTLWAWENMQIGVPGVSRAGSASG